MTKFKNNFFDTIIVGGGAAGFFAAIQLAQQKTNIQILILEKSPKVLEKVRISGGGRCNVTHACFEPKDLVKNYPRGYKELLGPFHQFMCGDMMAWLDEHGVVTKIEADGRVFPASNSSQSIIDCFLRLCKKYKITIRTKMGVDSFHKEQDKWNVHCKTQAFRAQNIILATGSNRAIWAMLKQKSYSIEPPVPSLFTFKIKHPLIQNLAGVSVASVSLCVADQKHIETGPLLITHKGLSGPAVLKLSAWQAKLLATKQYQFSLLVNWINEDYKSLLTYFKSLRETAPKTKFSQLNNTYKLPKRLWKNMLSTLQLEQKNFAESSNKNLEQLATILCACRLEVNGKNTNKDEFVTCGGVSLNQVDFKTMQSKGHENLFFAGEILNIDAITGGFNFQNAWTTAYIAAKHIANT